MRAVVAASCLLMGCLVTKKEFPQDPFCPPSVETATLETASRPLSSVIVVDLGEEPAGDAGTGAGPLEFQVQVRDCNEDQELRYLVLLNGSRILQDIIPPDGRDPHEFQIDRAVFDARAGTCNQLEMRVSGDFRFDQPTQPVEALDLGIANWWVAVIDSRDPEVAGVEMALCP